MRLETFADLEEALSRVTDYEKEQGYRYTGKTFDLARMNVLLERLGRPEKSSPTLHVAGTKGKGSTAATAAALLRATGASPVGLYTSPHLGHLSERIRVNGRAASEEDWLVAARAVLAEGLRLEPLPTFFELTTAMAFELFRRAGCEAAVIEVGLGGRLDATNVLEPPGLAVSVVTRIGLDHTALLGKTHDAIALEKAAIARSGVPLLSAEQVPEAARAIEDHARRVGAPLERVGVELRVEVERVSLDGTRFSLETPRGRYRGLETPLVGRYQAENAALAVAAVEHVWRGPLRASASGESLEDDVRRGLARVRWRGRFDLVRPREGCPVVVDGAHDPGSMERLVAAFREVIPGVAPVVLLAIAKDKEIDLVLDALRGFPARAVCCRARTKRAAEPADLVAGLAARGVEAEAFEGSSADALARAREQAGRDGIVLSAGSLYLAGEVLAALGESVE